VWRPGWASHVTLRLPKSLYPWRLRRQGVWLLVAEGVRRRGVAVVNVCAARRPASGGKGLFCRRASVGIGTARARGRGTEPREVPGLGIQTFASLLPGSRLSATMGAGRRQPPIATYVSRDCRRLAGLHRAGPALASFRRWSREGNPPSCCFIASCRRLARALLP